MLIFLLYNKSSVVAEMGDRLATTDMGRKLGAVPLWGGAGSPCNTMSPEPTSTSLSSGILTHPAVCPQQTKLGVMCPFLRGAGSSCNTMWPWPRPTPVSNGTLIHAPFGHNTWAKIAGAVPPPLGGERASHLTQCRLGRGLAPYQAAS